MRLLAATPTSVFSQLGSEELVIEGSEFGESDADIKTVTIGGVPCLQVTYLSPGSIQCRTPRGAGRGLSVEVTNAFGFSSVQNSLFAYNDPIVDAISPNYDMRYEQIGNKSSYLPWMRSFFVSGFGFGWSPADVDEVSVGGQVCGSVLWLSNSMLQCGNVSALTWSGNEVKVTVQSQQASAAVFQHYSSPSISAVTPGTTGTTGDVPPPWYTIREDRVEPSVNESNANATSVEADSN